MTQLGIELQRWFDDDPLWPVGTQVVKPQGYPFPGEIRAVFTTKAGQLRYVVESDAAPGLQHIFAPAQLEAVP